MSCVNDTASPLIQKIREHAHAAFTEISTRHAPVLTQLQTAYGPGVIYGVVQATAALTEPIDVSQLLYHDSERVRDGLCGDLAAGALFTGQQPVLVLDHVWPGVSYRTTVYGETLMTQAMALQQVPVEPLQVLSAPVVAALCHAAARDRDRRHCACHLDLECVPANISEIPSELTIAYLTSDEYSELAVPDAHLAALIDSCIGEPDRFAVWIRIPNAEISEVCILSAHTQ